MSNTSVQEAVNGMDFSDGKIRCKCGETLWLHWNGGELDSKSCTCGRYYYTEHRKTVLVIEEVQ